MRWVSVILLAVGIAALLTGCYYRKEVTKLPDRTVTVTEFQWMEDNHV